MKKLLCFLFTFAIVGKSSSSIIKSKNETEDRSSKFLPFLAVVSFPNTECPLPNGSKGVCFSKKQCTAKGGTPSVTTCAEGYGVCCTFTQSCPAGTGGGEVTIKNNLTVISSANLAFPHSCKFVIPKQKGVCQIRLDFIRFQLGNVAAPTTPQLPPWFDPPEHNCVMDKMTISATTNLPNGLFLCGYAQDHVYLDYGSLEKITIDMNAVTQGGYDIKVTMIKCNSQEKAPDGCTQYFTDRMHKIMSFNYPFAQLNSERYSVCIANPDAAQKITWRPCPPITGTNVPASQFFISGQTAGAGNSTPAFCALDHVLLPGTPDERYCGGDFTNSVESYKIPFIMWVDFNNWEVPPEASMISMTIDPITTCPLYQTCIDTTGAPSIPVPPATCDSGLGACAVSQIYADMIDAGNTGFCLEYAVGP